MIYKFNNFKLDTRKYNIQANGKELAIEPQVFNLIVYLIKNKNKVVTRNEILDHVWQGRIVSDTSISNHIKSARKILGDDGNKQTVIKTVYGQGYQFIAKLEESVHKAVKIKSSHQSAASKILIVVLIIFAIIMWQKYQATNTQPHVSERQFTVIKDKSIAVLAFKDLSPQSDQGYFSDGISEELLNIFTKIPELRVASRTSSFSFKNKTLTLEKIGRELNVSYIIEGSVRKSGSQLRITVQLIRVDDGFTIWSKTYDHTLEDVLKIQDKIASAVKKHLEISLSNGMQRSESADPAAHFLYLKALYNFRENTDTSIKQALKIINQSIAIDPNYATAWILSSRIHYKMAIYAYDKDNSASLQLAKEAVNKAKALDNKDATANAQMALINLTDYDFEAARFNIDLAMSSQHKSSATIDIIANYLLLTGQIEKSIRTLDEAINLDPANDNHYLILSKAYLTLNQLENAHELIKKYSYYHTDGVGQHALNSYICIVKGDYQQALDEAQQEINKFWKLSILEFLNFAQGNIEQADAALNELLKNYSYSAGHLATHYSFRNDLDNAFKWLEKSYQNHDTELLYIINHHALRKLWGDPRWDKFIEKIGLSKNHWLHIRNSDKKS